MKQMIGHLKGNGHGNGMGQPIGQQFNVQVRPEDWKTCEHCKAPERLWVKAEMIAEVKPPVIGAVAVLVSNPNLVLYLCKQCGMPYGTPPDTRLPKQEVTDDGGTSNNPHQ
jgi:hypothetical protein